MRNLFGPVYIIGTVWQVYSTFKLDRHTMFDIHDKTNYTRDSIEFIILYTSETNYIL